jgi:hypothetical protein
MKGDFSRESFDPLRHYSRVLQQQGRVELDADGNERQAIQLHHLRSLAKDLIGPHGGPGIGFKIVPAVDEHGKRLPQDFRILNGHYYIDGWLCENEGDVYYVGDKVRPSQPWLRNQTDLERGKTYLAYLDVWERHVTAAEVDNRMDIASPNALREVALGGPDTTTRAQVVWQVRVMNMIDGAVPIKEWAKQWEVGLAQLQPAFRGHLKARAADAASVDAGNPSVALPQSRYRGQENRLYRIEIHRGGGAGDETPPTFVWSRENGSVLFAVDRISDRSLTLVEGWLDSRLDISIGDVVEISDEDTVLTGAVGSLVRVTNVDFESLTISFEPGSLTTAVDVTRRPVLRRWDHGHRNGDPATAQTGGPERPIIANDLALTLTEGGWLTIEDGISVFFEAAAKPEKQRYRSGDFWLIPARTAVGDILWLRTETTREPLAQPPHGVNHHYAPLAIVRIDKRGRVAVLRELAKRFKSLVELSK